MGSTTKKDAIKRTSTEEKIQKDVPDQEQSKEVSQAKEKAGPYIYQGPNVRLKGFHLVRTQIFKKRPVFPEKAAFLEEFCVSVKELGRKKAELNKKYPAAAKKAAALKD